MTTQISPKILKAALVTLDPFGLPRVIIFQYNPEQVSRSLQTLSSGDGGARSEALRLDGAPAETISFQELVLDATDQLETNDEVAKTVGILPQLAALEILLYPQSALVIANTALLAAGTIEIIPPEAPLTVLVWGWKRVLPVRITEYSVTEQMFDPDLNPIRATANIGLRVLSYSDVPYTHPGYYLFLTHQISKEVLAATATSSDLSAIGGSTQSDIGRTSGGGLIDVGNG